MNQLANRIPSLILRSPLHRLVSSRYLVIEFTGRTSGRTYRTPVAYVRDGDRLLLSTDSPWWRNFIVPAPIRVWLTGKIVRGTAAVLTDPADSASAIRRLVEAIPSYAGPAELAKDADGRVSDHEIARGVRDGRVGIRVDLGAQG